MRRNPYERLRYSGIPNDLNICVKKLLASNLQNEYKIKQLNWAKSLNFTSLSLSGPLWSLTWRGSHTHMAGRFQLRCVRFAFPCKISDGAALSNFFDL